MWRQRWNCWLCNKRFQQTGIKMYKTRKDCVRKEIHWNCLFVCTLSYLPTPPIGQDMTQGQFFKRSLTGLNSEFSFSETSYLTKVEEPSLPYYLPIDGGRIIGFITFPRVLVLCEMQSVSSRIWTRVTVSISCDDNHYTTGTLFVLYGISTFVGYSMPNPFYTNKQFYFKQFSLEYVHSLIIKDISISNYSVYSNSFISSNSVSYKYTFAYTHLNVKIVLFQAIQFSMSTQISYISSIDRTLSGATSPGQSRPGSDGNKGVLRIPQSSSVTGTSPSDCLVSYPGDSLRASDPSAEMYRVFNTPSRQSNWDLCKRLKFDDIIKFTNQNRS